VVSRTTPEEEFTMNDPTVRPNPEQPGTRYQPPDNGGLKDDIEVGPTDADEDIDEGTPIDEGTDVEPDEAGLDEG
jgi:hypothetical protein